MSETTSIAWSERRIAAYLARVTFTHKALVMVPRCSWTGNECDLLVVTQNLRIIDVEVKISRADLRADAMKEKWFHAWDWKIDGPMRDRKAPRRPRQWPHRVWKHYYCLPRDIWRPELFEAIAPVSGVLLMDHDHEGRFFVRCERMARPDRGAEKITAEDAIDIARLASFRMWDSFDEVERLKGVAA